MRNNKNLAIALILAAFLIAVFSPPAITLVKQDVSAPVVSLAASPGPLATPTWTHVGFNLTGGSHAKNAMMVKSSGMPFNLSIPKYHFYLPETINQ